VDAATLIRQTSSLATVLVGGQAVHFWATHYGIESSLSALTRDIDYQGTRAEARRAAKRVTYKHKLTIATMADATPNTAVLAIEMDGYSQPVIVDYLASVYGLDARKVKASAIEVEGAAGERFLIMDPLSLMQSKIWNLARLPTKKTREGMEQARLSIEIVAAMLRSEVKQNAVQRELLNMVKAVVNFSRTTPALEVQAEYGLDCIRAIPPEIFEDGILPPAFHDEYWPRVTRKSGLPAKKESR
jgi:hypothetical protein